MGEVMFINALNFVNWDELSDAERERLRTHLEEHKKVLQEALGHVNRNLKNAKRKPKRKRAVKRKAKRARRSA
jgi:hypothetical protein